MLPPSEPNCHQPIAGSVSREPSASWPPEREKSHRNLTQRRGRSWSSTTSPPVRVSAGLLWSLTVHPPPTRPSPSPASTMPRSLTRSHRTFACVWCTRRRLARCAATRPQPRGTSAPPPAQGPQDGQRLSHEAPLLNFRGQTSRCSQKRDHWWPCSRAPITPSLRILLRGGVAGSAQTGLTSKKEAHHITPNSYYLAALSHLFVYVGRGPIGRPRPRSRVGLDVSCREVSGRFFPALHLVLLRRRPPLVAMGEGGSPRLKQPRG